MQNYSREILSKIDSIKVPKIYEYGRFKSTDLPEDRIFYFIEMEHIPYDNISEYLRKKGKHVINSLNQDSCVLCNKIQKGINLLIKYGVHHNDLNGGNLLVDGDIDDPDVYLIDFGNATPYKIYFMAPNKYSFGLSDLKKWFNMKPQPTMKTGGNKRKNKVRKTKKNKNNNLTIF
jgi:serine/threonine protein kinase